MTILFKRKYPMEKLLENYLRILDIDPSGDFIRLINISRHRALDLSGVLIRQSRRSESNPENPILNHYQFPDSLRTSLRNREVVTIYSKGSNQLQCSIEPYLFVATDVTRWLNDRSVHTEISVNQTLLHSYQFFVDASNDIPTLYLNPPKNLDLFSARKTPLSRNDYSRFIFPYCLSNRNIVNPYTWGLDEPNDKSLERKVCYQSKETLLNFDSYPRRLTTAPQRSRSLKIR